MKKSKVYLVGAGPGDEGLITTRGAELIRQADCIIYDYLVNPKLLEKKKPNCKLIYVGKKAGSHTLSQRNINKLLVKEAKRHSKIIRLKGGDPFIFGRGAEEALYLKKNNIDFEIVPGVTSAIAVPSYAGIPLSERAMTSSVGFITGHENPCKVDSAINWNALAKAFGTIVFLMGVGNLSFIAKKLITYGRPKNTPASVIMWGTTPKQKTIVGTLSNIAGLAKKNKIFPPAIIVVGETVNLRKKLNWFEKKPLFGKRVVVTRTRNQASSLSEKLKALGAEVIEAPTIEVISLKPDKILKKALSLNKYNWIFFTSQNGVHEFKAFLDRAKLDARILADSRICAIGSETAKSLEDIGISADYVPKKFVAEEVVAYFRGEHHRKAAMSCTLILRAKKARNILPNGLRKAGFKVSVIDLYDTAVPPKSAYLVNQALAEGVDIITFTSSSTVENFIKLVGNSYRRKLSGIKLASIGPITSGTLKRFGLKVDVEAKVFTIDGLIEALEKQF